MNVAPKRGSVEVFKRGCQPSVELPKAADGGGKDDAETAPPLPAGWSFHDAAALEQPEWLER